MAMEPGPSVKALCVFVANLLFRKGPCSPSSSPGSSSTSQHFGIPTSGVEVDQNCKKYPGYKPYPVDIGKEIVREHTATQMRP